MNRLWSSLVWILSSWSVLFEQPQSWSKLKASGRLSLKLQSVVMPHVCFSDHLLPEIHSTKRSGLDPSLHWGKTFYYWKIWHFWRAESSETTTAQPQRLFFSKLKSVLGRDPEFNQIELRVRQKLFFWRASFFWKFHRRRVRIGLFLLKFRATDSWHLQHQSLTRLQKEDNAFTRLTRALSFFLKNIGQQPAVWIVISCLMWHTKRLYGGFCPPSFKEFLGLFPRPPPPSFFKMESRFTSSFLLHHPIFNGLEKIPQSSGQNWVKLGKYIYIVAAWGYFFLLSPFLYGIYLFEQDGKKLTQFTFFPIDFHCRIQDTDHRGKNPDGHYQVRVDGQLNSNHVLYWWFHVKVETFLLTNMFPWNFGADIKGLFIIMLGTLGMYDHDPWLVHSIIGWTRYWPWMQPFFPR